MATAELPSEASRAEAVAEAGMGAHSKPPTAVPPSDMSTDLEKGDHGGVSPSGSSDGIEGKHEKTADESEELQRSKGKTTLIMLALCVRYYMSETCDSY